MALFSFILALQIAYIFMGVRVGHFDVESGNYPRYRAHINAVDFSRFDPQGDDTLVRLLLGRGSAEIDTIREVFDMFESKKVGVTHKYFPMAKFSPEGLLVY